MQVTDEIIEAPAGAAGKVLIHRDATGLVTTGDNVMRIPTNLTALGVLGGSYVPADRQPWRHGDDMQPDGWVVRADGSRIRWLHKVPDGEFLVDPIRYSQISRVESLYHRLELRSAAFLTRVWQPLFHEVVTCDGPIDEPTPAGHYIVVTPNPERDSFSWGFRGCWSPDRPSEDGYAGPVRHAELGIRLRQAETRMQQHASYCGKVWAVLHRALQPHLGDGDMGAIKSVLINGRTYWFRQVPDHYAKVWECFGVPHKTHPVITIVD